MVLTGKKLHMPFDFVAADLPINNLPDSHSDAKVAEGLARIKALDAKYVCSWTAN